MNDQLQNAKNAAGSVNSRKSHRSSGRTLVIVLHATALILLTNTTTFAQVARQIGPQGFGDRANSYAWSMAEFRGKIYIGTNHNFGCIQRSLSGTSLVDASTDIPVVCEERLIDTDLRGRIYAFDPRTNQIDLVYTSPTLPALTSSGVEVSVAIDPGYRSMLTIKETDGTEALYVATFVTSEIPGRGPRLLRTTDGKNFEELPGKIPGAETYASYRSLTMYKNRMYVIALGAFGQETVLLESIDPASGEFRIVNEPNFGDPVNISAFELEVFQGYLYLGTATISEGFQLLRTQADGLPPYRFDPVLVDGAFRGAKNQNVVSLRAYKNHLYVGTGLNFVALQFFPDLKPAAPELLRVRGDGSWDIVCGEARNTPDGAKTPISGMGPGCDNPWSGYIWRMVVHNDVLFMSNFDMALFADYIDLEDFAGLEVLRDLLAVEVGGAFGTYLRELNLDAVAGTIARVQGGFDLWSTTNGIQWENITRTGFGDRFNYGIRSYLSTAYGLFAGTANPYFGFKLFVLQSPDSDFDNDSILDANDNCPLDWNLSQSDGDGDGLGDVCDNDNNNDCIADDIKLSETQMFATTHDNDADGTIDSCDFDDDNDGVPDHQDNCIFTANFSQRDSDRNGVGDACSTIVVDAPANDFTDRDVMTPRPVCGAIGGVNALLMIIGGLVLFQNSSQRPGGGK